MAIAEAEGLEKKFKMTSSISLSNMVCFDKDGRIRKFNNVNEILEDFYHLRLRYYQKRKEWLTDQLNQEWTKIDNKVRFVLEIINGTLIIQNRKKTVIFEDLKKKGYAMMGNKKDDGDVDSTKGYDYLLSMPLWNLTLEKVELLKKEKIEKETEINILLGKSPKDLWNEDLEKFLEQWNVKRY